MATLRITNRKYYIALILILVLLTFYNVFCTLPFLHTVTMIPLVIQIGLIFLLIIKSPISQVLINIWTVSIFFGLQIIVIIGFLTKLWIDMGNGETSELTVTYRSIYPLVLIGTGIVVWKLNENFGELIEE